MDDEYNPGQARIKEYLENPGRALAFVLAAAPDADAPEFILIAYGENILAQLDFDEARRVADFIYANIPQRGKAGLN